ncbi:class I SAM-dependent methyltransferase [Actinoplanes sp. NPDC026619]|uniref:class I SAM-dependent methyltransferase n=1 Tax=Actinoplanes sp. NPDC026619 TaxID=3155798 RepID=UPI0033FB1AEA
MTPHGRAQAALWGTDPEGWAAHAERQNETLFAAVLDAAGVTAGTRLLDVGCGTGRTLRLAADRGATVSGVDVSGPLLAVAARVAPEAELFVAELDELPIADGVMDAVVGVNAFQFAADPRVALAEASRVLAPGGRVVASLFAEPERSESTVIHRALAALAPPSGHAPYLLSEPGRLDEAMTAAGLTVLDQGEVECVWTYANHDDVVRGLLSSAGGAQAVRAAGREATAAAIRAAAARYTAPDGSVAMLNTFRWTSALKEGPHA